MNILFTICARAGSKGLKSKNISDFCGRPLVQYTLSAYRIFEKKYSDEYDNIQLAVNTDSDELIKQIDKENINYLYIQRENSLAGDVVAKFDVIKDTLQKAELEDKRLYDIVIDLDLTSPLREVKDIKGTLDAVINTADADIAFSVTASRRSPYFNMVSRKEDGFYDRVIMTEYSCRQQTPVCYDMNASIYAYKRDYLLSGSPVDRKSVIWEMEDTAVLDIDCALDLKLMEVIATYLFEMGKYAELLDDVKC